MPVPRPNLVQLEFHLPELASEYAPDPFGPASVTVIRFLDPDLTASQVVKEIAAAEEAYETAQSAYLQARGLRRLWLGLVLRYRMRRSPNFRTFVPVALGLFDQACKNRRSITIKSRDSFQLLPPNESRKVREHIAGAATAYAFVYEDCISAFLEPGRLVASVN